MRISDWSSDVCSSDLCWTMKSSSGNSSGAEELFERLSPRQRECLRRIYLRSTSKEIATALDLGPGTVDTYITEAISSDERSVVKECVSTCRSRWSQSH